MQVNKENHFQHNTKQADNPTILIELSAQTLTSEIFSHQFK